MFGISYVTFVFCIMYYAPNRLLPGCACYWFTPIRYYQLISCINWPLVPAQNRGSPIPAASSETAKKTATRDRQNLTAQWVWKTAQLGGKTAELATLITDDQLITSHGEGGSRPQGPLSPRNNTKIVDYTTLRIATLQLRFPMPWRSAL